MNRPGSAGEGMNQEAGDIPHLPDVARPTRLRARRRKAAPSRLCRVDAVYELTGLKVGLDDADRLLRHSALGLFG